MMLVMFGPNLVPIRGFSQGAESSVHAVTCLNRHRHRVGQKLRYHFDLVDGSTTFDRAGRILPDDDHAIEAANLFAKRLRIARPDLIGNGLLVLVTDEDGREVHRVRLDRIP